MKIIYSHSAKEQLFQIKEYIARDNRQRAITYLKQIKSKIEILGKYPYIGKVNSTMNNPKIRDFVLLGYKIIYKINVQSIMILSVYKYIDFDESSL